MSLQILEIHVSRNSYIIIVKMILKVFFLIGKLAILPLHDKQ